MKNKINKHQNISSNLFTLSMATVYSNFKGVVSIYILGNNISTKDGKWKMSLILILDISFRDTLHFGCFNDHVLKWF